MYRKKLRRAKVFICAFCDGSVSFCYSPVWRQRFKQPEACIQLVYIVPDKQDQATAVSETCYDFTAIPQYKVQCKYHLDSSILLITARALPKMNIEDSLQFEKET